MATEAGFTQRPKRNIWIRINAILFGKYQETSVWNCIFYDVSKNWDLYHHHKYSDYQVSSTVCEDAVLNFEDTICPLALNASALVIFCLRGKNIFQI